MSDTKQEAIDNARRDYELALKAIHRMPRGAAAGGVEATLGQAYARLVQLGAAPKLRAKYRSK